MASSLSPTQFSLLAQSHPFIDNVSIQPRREHSIPEDMDVSGLDAVGPSLLDAFPDDLVLGIMKMLPFKDLIAFSMTNQRFHRLAQSLTVWTSQARMQLAGSRPLIFPLDISYIIMKQHIISLSVVAGKFADALRHSVITASNCFRSLTHVGHATMGPMIVRTNAGIVRSTPQHAFVLRSDADAGRGAQEIAGYDAKNGYRKRAPLGGTVHSLRWDWATNSWYCVAGTCLAGIRDAFQLAFSYVRVYDSPPHTSPTLQTKSSTPATNMVNDTPNDANVPGPTVATETNPDLLTSDTFARFQMPYSVDVGVRILDIPARTAVVLFEVWGGSRRSVRSVGCEPTSTLGLAIILDWETGKSVVVDTGLPFNHRNTSISVHLTPTRSHLLIHTEANIVDCVGNITDSTPKDERCVRRVHRRLLNLRQLKQRAKPWEEVIEEVSKVVKGRRGEGAKWVVDGKLVRKMSEKDEALGVWVASTQVDHTWNDGVLRALLDGARDPSEEKAVSTSATHPSSTHTRTPTFPLSHHNSTQSDIQPPSALLHMESSEMIRTWIQHKDWPLFRGEGIEVEPGARSRVSKTSLYSVAPQRSTAGAGAGKDKVWYLVQSYVGASEEEASVDTVATDTVVSYHPTIVPLLNPVLVDNAVRTAHIPRAAKDPLVSVSFNYALWVEESPDDDLSLGKPWWNKASKKLMKLIRLQHLGRRGSGSSTAGSTNQTKFWKLRLASFRGSEDGHHLSPSSISSASSSRSGDFRIAKVSTLDVPQAVLQKARQLLLDETEARVTIACDDGDVYSYSIV